MTDAGRELRASSSQKLLSIHGWFVPIRTFFIVLSFLHRLELISGEKIGTLTVSIEHLASPLEFDGNPDIPDSAHGQETSSIHGNREE